MMSHRHSSLFLLFVLVIVIGVLPLAANTSTTGTTTAHINNDDDDNGDDKRAVVLLGDDGGEGGKDPSAFKTGCFTQNCPAITDCTSCAQTPNCAWCTATSRCMDAYPDNGPTLCGDEVCLGCLRCNWEGYDGCTPFTECPASGANCRDFSSCGSCSEQPNCAWCTETKTCMDAYGDNGATLCNKGEVCKGCLRCEWPYYDDCSNFTACPADDLECSDLTSCGACGSQPNCAWCTATGSCMDAYGDNGVTLCNAGLECPGCLRAMWPYYDDCNEFTACPANDTACSDYLNCGDCGSQANCAWCTATGTCVDAFGSGGINMCNADAVCEGCLRAMWPYYDDCNEFTACPANNSECSDFTNCGDCGSQANCAWCTATGTCMAAFGSGGINICNKGEYCDGCLRAMWPYYDDCTEFTACPSNNIECSDFTSCRACAEEANCVWCTATGTCEPAVGDGGATLCNAAASCEGCLRCEWSYYGDCSNFTACPADDLECSDFTSCADCAVQANCAWCASTNRCLSAFGSSGPNVCNADNVCPSHPSCDSVGCLQCAWPYYGDCTGCQSAAEVVDQNKDDGE